MQEKHNGHLSSQVADPVNISDQGKAALNATPTRGKNITDEKDLSVEERNQVENLKKIDQQENALADPLPNLSGSAQPSSTIGRSIDVII